MADINLSKAVRSNLGSLQNTAALMSKTSDRLSTGNKVNTALDNPTNFFTASSLNSRAGDLNNLMDSMANGIKTIEAANNGLTAITKNLESMQSTLRQARQDKSFLTTSFDVPKNGTGGTTPAGTEVLTFGKGAFGDTATSSISLTKSVTTGGTTTPASNATASGTSWSDVTVADGAADLTFEVNGQTVSLAAGSGSDAVYDADAVASAINTQVGTSAGVIATVDSGTGALVLTSTGTAGGADTLTVDNFSTGDATALGFAAASVSTTGAAASTTGGTTTTTWKSTDELVNEINASTVSGGGANPLNGKIRASNDNGKLRIENLSTTDLSIVGATSTAVTGGTGASNTSSIKGNSVRSDLASQFNELRDQLDKLSDDASFNGINLLRGDKLKITFNETGTSSIDIQTKGEKAVDSTSLQLTTTLQAKDLDSDESIDTFLNEVKTALNNVRSQSSAFGSNLSIVQNRQDFTRSMIDTLETGAGNLTLADMNQEAANMMALQTRQSLAQSTLSMANQADQGVLQLLR